MAWGREMIVYLTMVALARERPINLLPGRRWPGEAGAEEERRNLECGMCLVKMRKRWISTRIPLQPQCAHWGSFPPGEA